MIAYSALVYRFYAYRALVAEGFVYPIIILYALAQGLTLGDIGLATGAFFLGILLGEVPTGYIGDRIGRRNSLVLGAVTISLTHIGFALADTLIAFVSLYAFWGVAWTFRSGSADAWLYDILVERNAAETYTHVRGRATSTFYASAATTALLGGVLYEIHPSLPFLAAASVTALAAIVMATLPEPAVTQESDGFSFAEARAALSTVISNRRIGAFVGLSAVILAVPETVEIFVQPVMLDMGIRPAMLGPLYAGLMGTAAIGSSQAARIKRWLGTARWFTVGPAVLASVLVLAVLIPVVAIPAFFLSRGINTATDTLGSTFLNDLLASHGRATALSGVSMIYALVNFFARTAGGATASLTSPFVALAGFSCLAVIALVGIRAVADPFVERRTTKQTR
jgi:MFS family permease